MNNIKRLLGYLWMIIGPAAVVFMIWQAFEKISAAYLLVTNAQNEAAKQAADSVAINTFLQWAIIILVFLPIAFGMVIFGKYATTGEYDHLPLSSEDLDPVASSS